MIAARYLVRGRVQGVGFRAAAAHEARRRGLRGHARNLADGRVEVVVAGEAVALDAFAGWLHHGPPLARVEGVEQLPADPDALPSQGFQTG